MTLKVKWKNDIWLKVMGNCIAVLLEAVVKYTNTQSMKKRHFSRIKNGRENERCGIYEKISVSSGSLVCNKKWICYSGNLKISYYHASQTHKNFPWWTPPGKCDSVFGCILLHPIENHTHRKKTSNISFFNGKWSLKFYLTFTTFIRFVAVSWNESHLSKT